jgi:hypothetical protein
MTDLEDVYPVRDQPIDEGIPFEHVEDHLVIKGIAAVEEAKVDLRENALEFPKGRVDRGEIQYAHLGLQAV